METLSTSSQKIGRDKFHVAILQAVAKKGITVLRWTVIVVGTIPTADQETTACGLVQQNSQYDDHMMRRIATTVADLGGHGMKAMHTLILQNDTQRSVN